MGKVKITAVRRARYDDLIARYENPIDRPCTIEEGQVFYTEGEKPEALCESAWETLSPFVAELLRGGGDFYGGWMKDPKSALLSCNDGFRPVSFLLQVVEEL